MSNSTKTKQKEQNPQPYTGKAVAAFRCTSGDGLLAVSAVLTIVDGKVTHMELTGAPNLPAAAIGQGSAELWRQVREQRIDAT